MLWEIFKYFFLLTGLCLVLLIEQVLALPFIFFTLLMLWTNRQTPLMSVLTIVTTSLVCAVIFGQSWLLLFAFIALAIHLVKFWQTRFINSWWASNLQVLIIVTMFSLIIPPQSTAQFLVFSSISYLISLIILWGNYHWLKRQKFSFRFTNY